MTSGRLCVGQGRHRYLDTADGKKSRCRCRCKLYNRETGLISTDIPMDRGQSLRIELVLMCGEKHYDIKSWYVYASDEYEIDNSMPVWGGAAPSQE